MATTHSEPKTRLRGLRRRRGLDSVNTLFLHDEAGDVVYASLPPVTATLRQTVARLRLSNELPKRLGVIAAIRGEGVTSIARSLALVLTHDSTKRVCIVELNWWGAGWPGLADGGEAGLAGVLSGSTSLTDAVVRTGNAGLFVLPAGPVTPEERSVLASTAELRVVLDELDRHFDHVLLDLPALQSASEALTLASHASAVAVVVRQGVTSEDQVKAALEQLESVPVLGVVLNASATKVPDVILRRIPSA